MHDASRRIVEAGIILLLLLSPLPFGSVKYWAVFVIGACCACLALLTLLVPPREPDRAKQPSEGADHRVIPPLLKASLAAFAVLMLVQIIPLPSFLVAALSEKRAMIHGLTAPGESAADWLAVSVFPYATAVEIWKFAAYVLAGWLTYRVVTSRAGARRIAIALVFSAVFQAGYGLFEFASGRQHILGYQKIHYIDCATGTFINRNHFAGFLELAFPILWALVTFYWSRASSEKSDNTGSREKSILLLFFGALMVTGLIASASRGGIFALAATFLAFQVIRPTLKGNRANAGLAAVFCLLVLLFSLWLGTDGMRTRIGAVGEDLAAAGNRLGAWKVTGRMISDFPILGSGLGTYRHAFPVYRPTAMPLNFAHAHNDYLELASDAGLVGAALLLGFLAGFLIVCIRRFSKRRSLFARRMALGGMTAIAAILVHSVYDFNLHIPANALTFSIVMGWTLACASRRMG